MNDNKTLRQVFSVVDGFFWREMFLQQTSPSHSAWFFDIVKEGRWRWFSRTQVALKSTAQPQVAWEDGGQNDSMLDLDVQETFHLHCYIWMCDFESIFSSDFLARCDRRSYSSIWEGGTGEDAGKCRVEGREEEEVRSGGVWVWLGRVLQQLIKVAGQVFQD